MRIFNNCRVLSSLSSAYKRGILLKQNVNFQNVYTTLKERRILPYQLTVNVSACQLWHNVSPCCFHTNRCYSELMDDSNSKNGVFKDETNGTESDFRDSSAKSQRSSEVFTLDVLVALLKQENAVDVCVIKVPEQIQYAEYFIVASGLSTRHLKAMALYAIKVYKFMKKDHDSHVKIEGKDAEDWMCIDFGSIVVHFMLPETREVYEIEKLWTLRSFDEQLKNMPVESLPEDFIYDAEVTK